MKNRGWSSIIVKSAPKWRNRQTRATQNRVRQTLVPVQVRPSAPKICVRPRCGPLFVVIPGMRRCAGLEARPAGARAILAPRHGMRARRRNGRGQAAGRTRRTAAKPSAQCHPGGTVDRGTFGCGAPHRGGEASASSARQERGRGKSYGDVSSSAAATKLGWRRMSSRMRLKA